MTAKPGKHAGCCRDQGEFDALEQGLPRHVPIQFRALSYRTEQRQEGVCDAPQDRDGNGSSGVLKNEWVQVLFERNIESLVSNLHTPMVANDPKPLLGRKTASGHATDEVAETISNHAALATKARRIRPDYRAGLPH
jgi:hypothetical protein